MEVGDLRRELTDRICFILSGYDVPIQEVRSKLILILNDFDITPSEKALTVYSAGKNQVYLQRFLISKKVGGRTERTLRSYNDYLRRILPQLGKDADQVTVSDLITFFALRMRDGLSPAGINNERHVLSSFFSFLQREGIIQQNPVTLLDMGKVKEKPKKAFTDLEIEKLRAELRDARERAIFETLLSTGCRCSELTSIKIEDILSDGSISILGKGEKYRTVFLNAKAKVAIERYLKERSDGNPYLFPRAAGKIGHGEILQGNRSSMHEWYLDPGKVDPENHCSNSAIESLIRKLGERAGVEKVHPHKFRRTCATFALQKGMPLTLVSKMLGHESVATTQIYLDINEDDLRNAHKKFVQQ